MCIGDFSPTWKEAAEADIAEDSATTTNTTIPTSHSQLRFVIYICFVQLWRCKDAVLPACFFFPRAAACLILACLITFICRSAAFHTHTQTHTSGQVLVLLVVERQGSTALQQRCAATIVQMLFLACKLSSCRSCRSVLVALAQLEVADNSSSTHTTTTQLQLVSQGKDAVIGSSVVALVVLVQRGKKRSVQCNSFCFGDLSPTWKEAAEADIAEDSVTTTRTTITTSQ